MSNELYKIKYDIATNFDPQLIGGIRKIDTKNQIGTVFGKMRKDIFGGGRSSSTLPELSFEELEDYVNLCHKNNLKFNYLINAACLGNREVNPSEHKKIVEYITKLSIIGVDAITLNSPYLCELIKKQFPNMYITIGVAAYVFNCKHIKYWEELGADEITLPHSVNRDFSALEEILKFTKNRDISVRAIANNICLHECPYKMSHSSSQSHASQEGSETSDLYIDYNLLSCNNKKIRNPENLISSEWIRPEDVHYYEEICNRVGNHKFSLKLVDRTKTTEFLLRVVKAYIEESYDGNLLDIVCWPSTKDTKEIHKDEIYSSAVNNKFNFEQLEKYYETFNLPNINVNNKKLDGFIEKFRENNDCHSKVCGKSNDVENKNDKYCFYCLSWAKECISYDQKEINEWLKKSDYSLEQLKNSKFFIS